MPKHPLAIAIACAATAVAAPATAVSLNPKGLGQVLIYPYYTVNKNQDTLLSVVNTDDVGKVVHVSFNEGYNGRNVREFKLFLSPHDTWTARVSALGDGDEARLVTTDKSCVFGAIDADGNDMRVNGLPLRAWNYAGGGVFPPDGGPTSLARAREGSIQIIAVGDIIPGSPTDTRTTHVQDGTPNGGRPAGCDEFSYLAIQPDIVTPGNGLYGSASIVNVGEGTFFGYGADALSGFTALPVFTNSAAGNFETLARANSADSAFPAGAKATVSTKDGKSIELDYERGIDAVSAVFMAESISNEAIVASALGANTDWIVTFPTKPFYTDPYYIGDAMPAVAPFTQPFAAPGQAPVAIDYALYDQEELWVSDPCGQMCGLPPPVPPLAAPYVVNAIGIRPFDSNADAISGVLGSRLTENVKSTFPGWDSGWMKLVPQEQHVLPGGTSPAGVAVRLKGLPMTGFMVYNVINANAAPGKLANYGGLFSHRAGVACTAAATPPGTPDPCA